MNYLLKFFVASLLILKWSGLGVGEYVKGQQSYQDLDLGFYRYEEPKDAEEPKKSYFIDELKTIGINEEIYDLLLELIEIYKCENDEKILDKRSMGYTPFKYKFRQGKRYHLKKKLKQKSRKRLN